MRETETRQTQRQTQRDETDIEKQNKLGRMRKREILAMEYLMLSLPVMRTKIDHNYRKKVVTQHLKHLCVCQPQA